MDKIITYGEPDVIREIQKLTNELAVISDKFSKAEKRKTQSQDFRSESTANKEKLERKHDLMREEVRKLGINPEEDLLGREAARQ